MTQHEETSKISKNALLTFSSLALFVYAIALTYCLVTEHTLGATLISIAGIIIGLFTKYTYSKL